MNAKEKVLISDLLKEAAGEFICHGCNDIPESYFEGWTEEEKLELLKDLEAWAISEIHGTVEGEYDNNIRRVEDFVLMEFLAYKILKEK